MAPLKTMAGDTVITLNLIDEMSPGVLKIGDAVPVCAHADEISQLILVAQNRSYRGTGVVET